MRFSWIELMSWSIIIALIITLVGALSGCKVTEYVPVETIKEKEIYLDRVEVDTMYCLDSIIIKEKGDCEDTEHIKYVYKYRYVHDTTSISKIDSIPYMVEVEKKLTNREEFYMKFGKKSFPFCVLLVIAMITYLGYKFYKK